MPYQEERTHVQIERLGDRGEGVACWDGLPLFVPGGLPGEEVEVGIVVRKPTYCKGELTRVLQPSAQRERPLCRFFPDCGGCQLQHLTQEGQLAFKRTRVVRALARHGLHPVVEPVRPSPAQWGYRCKMLMPVEGLHMGLYAADSHRLVRLSECLVHCASGEMARSALQAWLHAEGPFPLLKHVLMRTSHTTGEVLVALVVADAGDVPWRAHAAQIVHRCPQIAGIVLNKQPLTSNTILGGETTPLYGRCYIEEALLGIPVELSAPSFFQVNPPQAEAIGQDILQWAALHPNSHICDAYCGAGALALALARDGHDVTGIEVVPSAIEDARRTAHRLEIHANFICSLAEDSLTSASRSWDALILNPPRKGCTANLLEKVLDMLPDRLCLLYCEPVALARDLQRLATGYHIDLVRPYDLFPQTAHVECLALLTRS